MGRQPGFKHRDETKAKIRSSISATLAAKQAKQRAAAFMLLMSLPLPMLPADDQEKATIELIR